jgi:hypothetical protein
MNAGQVQEYKPNFHENRKINGQLVGADDNLISVGAE